MSFKPGTKLKFKMKTFKVKGYEDVEIFGKIKGKKPLTYRAARLHSMFTDVYQGRRVILK